MKKKLIGGLLAVALALSTAFAGVPAAVVKADNTQINVADIPINNNALVKDGTIKMQETTGENPDDLDDFDVIIGPNYGTATGTVSVSSKTITLSNTNIPEYINVQANGYTLVFEGSNSIGGIDLLKDGVTVTLSVASDSASVKTTLDRCDNSNTRFELGPNTKSVPDVSTVPKESGGINVELTYSDSGSSEYSISFDANGGTGKMDSPITYESADVTLPANGYTKEGYTFKEWNTKEDGTGTAYADKAKITLTTKDLTLYAQWTSNEATEEFTVQFDANGKGSAKFDPQTVLKGKKVTKPTDPTAEGYTFGGWHTDKDCTKEWNFDDPVTANMTLYAKWTETKIDDKQAETAAEEILKDSTKVAELPTTDAFEAPSGSDVKVEGVEEIKDTTALETLNTFLADIVKATQDKDSVEKVFKFDLKATGSGKVRIRVGNYNGKIAVIGHFSKGAWRQQQVKVEGEYVDPEFSGFSPVTIVITNKTDTISGLSTAKEESAAPAKTETTTSSSSSSSSGSSGGPKTITIDAGGHGASVTPAGSVQAAFTGLGLADANGVLPAGAKLSASALVAGDAYNKALAALGDRIVGKAFAIAEMNMADAQGAALHQLNGFVSITMTLPFTPAAGNGIAVYRIEDDGTATLLTSSVAGGNLTFETNHFSTYAFVETAPSAANAAAAGTEAAAPKAVSPKAASPKTGDPSDMLSLLALAAAAAATGVFVRKWRVTIHGKMTDLIL